MLSLAQGCSEHAADLNRDTLCCSDKDGIAAVTMLVHNLNQALEICFVLCWEYSRAGGQQALLAYQRCAKRINRHSGTHCTGQYFDYCAGIDKCAALRLFYVLK